MGILRVHITSFSYKRGYPQDGTGHGGGFVFDCRALPNPGREQAYKAMCGCDPPVIAYLESQERVAPFWQHVSGLVGMAVQNYLDRDFTDLSIAFGCTGGQHRSVYFAERLADHLRLNPGLEILLEHREQAFWPIPAG